MPQLDIATYASQLFWLILVFWSFYLIAFKHLLPNISSILKLREKKLKKAQATLDFHSAEQTELLAQSDRILQQAFIESRQIILQLFSYSSSWTEHTVSDLNTKELKDTKTLVTFNKKYLDAMASIAAKKYLLRLVAEEDGFKI